MMQHQREATPSSVKSREDNSLQSVSQFKQFLLQNDSHFIEYINSDLLVHILDA